MHILGEHRRTIDDEADEEYENIVNQVETFWHLTSKYNQLPIWNV